MTSAFNDRFNKLNWQRDIFVAHGVERNGMSPDERRSKFPPLVVDGVDINESSHRMAEQALVEVEIIKTSGKRLKGLIKALFVCKDAGAQLPADLLDQISALMGEFIVEMRAQDIIEMSAQDEGGSP